MSPNNSFKPTPCRGIGHVLYATLAHVRRPNTGRLNSGVRCLCNFPCKTEHLLKASGSLMACARFAKSLVWASQAISHTLTLVLFWQSLETVPRQTKVSKRFSPSGFMAHTQVTALPHRLILSKIQASDSLSSISVLQSACVLSSAPALMSLIASYRAAPNNSFKPTPHRGVGHVPALR